MWTLKNLFVQQLRLQNVTRREIPIFILILFHYQLFLLVSESFVFPDSLWAREDLDRTAGRQPVLKMHGLVCGTSNYSMYLWSQMSFVSVKPTLLSFFCVFKCLSALARQNSCVRVRFSLLTAVINVGHPVGLVLVFYVSVTSLWTRSSLHIRPITLVCRINHIPYFHMNRCDGSSFSFF